MCVCVCVKYTYIIHVHNPFIYVQKVEKKICLSKARAQIEFILFDSFVEAYAYFVIQEISENRRLP